MVAAGASWPVAKELLTTTTRVFLFLQTALAIVQSNLDQPANGRTERNALERQIKISSQMVRSLVAALTGRYEKLAHLCAGKPAERECESERELEGRARSNARWLTTASGAQL